MPFSSSVHLSSSFISLFSIPVGSDRSSCEYERQTISSRGREREKEKGGLGIQERTDFNYRHITSAVESLDASRELGRRWGEVMGGEERDKAGVIDCFLVYCIFSI